MPDTEGASHAPLLAQLSSSRDVGGPALWRLAHRVLLLLSVQHRPHAPPGGACVQCFAACADALRCSRGAGLSLMEQDILKDWKAKFEAKYAKVGTVKR